MADIFELFKKIQKSPEGTSDPIRYIVVGLGNPGDKYIHTRHNAGFMALDALAEKKGFKVDRLKYHALITDACIASKRVLFMKPQTYMNNSGVAVREAAAFYKVPVENVIVIFDDISLEPGKIRLRKKGSAGGHNGIKSIIEHLGSDSFPRIKIGVGAKPHPDYDLADWVLGDIPKDKRDIFFDALVRAGESLELMLSSGIDAAMAKYN
ncbi:MAG: aminoacyl-tRNA hydrolase [Clostridia bacterium]|nr:aminoacyl-tRNA hydrolase [Clostridia bacterium]